MDKKIIDLLIKIIYADMEREKIINNIYKKLHNHRIKNG